MILKVNTRQNLATPVEPTDLTDEGIWERRDLQKWIIANPSILGEDLLVLDAEFDQFQGSGDRLDLLRLDEDGAPVIVELKRDRHAGHADLQSLRYAAKIRGLELGMASKILSRAGSRNGHGLDEQSAKAQILKFLDAEGETDLQLPSEPRIILASPGFSMDVSTTVLFLREHGLDITCIQLRAYRTAADEMIIVPDRLIPIKEADEYMAKLELREVREARGTRKRRGNLMTEAVARGLLRDGQELYLKHHLPTWVTYDANDPTFLANVVSRNGKRPNLRWKKDGQEYSASNLASKVFQDLRTDGGTIGGVAGPFHWGTETLSISELVDAVETPTELPAVPRATTA